MDHVVICGVSARAAATSAARAGFRVTAIDAFADTDHHPSVCALGTARDFGLPPTAEHMAAAARPLGATAAVYLSPFENHPRAIARLAAGRQLWGNTPATIRQVRDPRRLAEAFRRYGFAVPRLRTPNDPNDPNLPNDPNPPNHPNVRWLHKPRRSGGGQHVREWDGGRVARQSYLQQCIDGTPGSVVFVAARGRAVPLAVSRQLTGDGRFGATGYRYCGSIVAPAGDPQFDEGDALFAAAAALAQAAAESFGLVGVNGIDFIARQGVPYPIELNPRWCASLELIEERSASPVFALHARASVDGLLPADSIANGGAAVGKAVIYARGDITAPDTRHWLDDPDIRDVPRPGERFRAGDPVCTVVATAPDARRCHDALVAKAERIYVQLPPALTGPPRLADSVRA